MCANWSRCSGRSSAFAPASIRTDGPVLGRDHDGDRRARDSRQAAQLEEAGGEHRAGVPGGDDRVGLLLADRAAGGDERAVRLRLDGLGRLLVHCDLACRLDELQSLRVEACRAVEHRADRVGGSLRGTGDDFFGRAIAAQSVDGDGDHPATACGAARSRARRTSCKSGTCGAAASAGRTAGRGSGAARRSCAGRGACHGETWTAFSSGRSRRRRL